MREYNCSIFWTRRLQDTIAIGSSPEKDIMGRLHVYYSCMLIAAF